MGREHQSTLSTGLTAAFIICFFTIVGILIFTQANKKVPVTAPVKQQATVKPVTYDLTSHMMYIGEVFWGRAIETRSHASPDLYNFPFHGLAANDKAGYDAWIGDMECPITNTVVSYQAQVDYLTFNCRPEFLANAAKWFDVLSLANNHTNNVNGVTGLNETRQNLANAGVQYFGDYNMRNLDNICDVIAMPARLVGSDKSVKKATLPVALCGYDYVGNVIPQQDEYDVMKAYSKVMPVVAFPHMGVEYRATAEQFKIDTYHAMIDNGADIVIGAHVHVVQNTENYKGRLIIYSIGNFIFDQQILGEDTILALAAGLNLTVHDQTAIKNYESLQNCQVEHDTCLAQLQSVMTTRPPIDVGYNADCYYEPNYFPIKADDKHCQEIMTRSNWPQTMQTNLSKTW